MNSSRACLLIVFLAACGDDGGSTPQPDAAGPGDPSVSAVVAPDTVAPGGNIDITITAMNFTLVDPSTMPPVADGEGHYHVYLDNATGGDYEAVGFDGSETITLDPAIAAGAHTFRIQLQQNDHMPLSPNVETTVNFTVQ